MRIVPTKMELILEQTQQGISHEVSKDSILQAENLVKEILLKLNLPDHSDEVFKLENFKKGALLKLFKLSNQERTVEKTKNKNGIGEARGKAYVLGGGDANPDSNVVTGTFLLNKHYAYVLFDSGADRSFMSTTFSTLLDIIPDTLDVSYAIKLVDERISETNTVLRGNTLGLLAHPFNIGLMPVELDSFDVIIGMDWLSNHHAVIVCDEKIVRIPYGDKVLIVQGDRGGRGKKSKLSIISCIQT
nr:reverse transcriptase domain-containing protein [Tanacetum cinerariifolium]